MRNRAAEILQLNDLICETTETNLQRALRIGELLTEQKEELPHGEWTPWLEQNIYRPGFSRSNVGRYMKLWKDRDKFKKLETGNLTDALRLAYTPRKERESTKNEIAERYPVELYYSADQEEDHDELDEELKTFLPGKTVEQRILQAKRIAVLYKEHYIADRSFKTQAKVRLGREEQRKISRFLTSQADADE